MQPRFEAIKENTEKHLHVPSEGETGISKIFGKRVFNRSVMKEMLPPQVYQNVVDAMEYRGRIKPEYADTIALAMKEWAVHLGATHYTHWFQPLTGFSAEKHDAFIEWKSSDEVIEKFSGKQLIKGEPDASSFPSGGLRSTYEARGYSAWDPTSPAIVWMAGDGVTLCIPSIFFSWTGEALDNKIPLLRSDQKINEACLRLLKLTGIKASRVYSSLGLEQEYFVVDRSLRNFRPDLVLIGRTVYGAAPSKGQELQDHYFGSVKDRILAYMRDFEIEALKLGIPVKTRHNEVAPAQHEIAPVYEKASTAVGNNILLMEIMRRVAIKHGLACLLHEKPFQGLNGSGKHCNWSLSTDTDINLLDPSDTPGNNLHFLILMTAILHAVHKHSALLRCSIGSVSNDYRLGGHEAPPAIISAYLGKEIEHILENIEKTGKHLGASKKDIYDLGLIHIPDLSKENTDRNRTSPFAFTGNKFEFRALGSSQSPALPATVLNVIVAESLNEILDAIEAKGVAPVLSEYLKRSKPIRFEGDNYSPEWVKEAKKRKLPNIKRSVNAFEALISKDTIKAFEGVLTKQELESRYTIQCETYAHNLMIEMNLMVELFRNQIYPAAVRHQRNLSEALYFYKQTTAAEAYVAQQTKKIKELTILIAEALKRCDDLDILRQKVAKTPLAEQARKFTEQIVERSEALREVVDQLEDRVEDSLWPLPKYRELLFMV